MRDTRVAIYTRVSTMDQSNEGQEHELRQYAKQRGWSVVRVYADKVSGLKSSRPAPDELLRDARKRKFSCVAVWRIDRLGRSVSHLLQVLETFKALGISFVSFTEAIRFPPRLRTAAPVRRCPVRRRQ